MDLMQNFYQERLCGAESKSSERTPSPACPCTAGDLAPWSHPAAGASLWPGGTSWATHGWQFALLVHNSSFLPCPCYGFPEVSLFPALLSLALACFRQWSVRSHDVSRGFKHACVFACFLLFCHLPREEFAPEAPSVWVPQ